MHAILCSLICMPQMAREAITALLHIVMVSSTAMVSTTEWDLTMKLSETMLNEQVVLHGGRNAEKLSALKVTWPPPTYARH